jgi:succinoglycan biosynthesis transport protein ExoP
VSAGYWRPLGEVFVTPIQILTILAARWKLAVLTCALVVVSVVAVSLTMFKRYTATAEVLLDARSADQIAGGALNGSLSGGYLATQMDVIASERVGRDVIRKLNLAQDPELRKAFVKAGDGQGNFEAWLSEVLSKDLVVLPAAVSNVVTIAYTSADAERAAQLANAYVDAYIEASLALRMERIRTYGSFYDERARELREALEAAQARVSSYQRQNSLIGADETVETARLSELTAQLVQLQGESSGLSGRLRQAGQAGDQLPEVSTDASVAALTLEVDRESIRLRELASRLGDNHPQLVEQRARVEELKSRLSAAGTRASSNIGFNSRASQARIAQLAAAVEAQRARLLKFQSAREKAVALQRDVERAQLAYDDVRKLAMQIGMESQNTQANLSILKRATVPLAPSSPKMMKNLAISLVAGALVGIGIVVGLEMLDRRVRSTDDLALSGLPLLVKLPVCGGAGRTAPDSAKTRLMKQRVVTSLPHRQLRGGAA